MRPHESRQRGAIVAQRVERKVFFKAEGEGGGDERREREQRRHSLEGRPKTPRNRTSFRIRDENSVGVS